MTTSPSPIETMLAEVTATPLANGKVMREMGFLMKPVIEVYDDDHAWLHFAFRSTSWDFPGERSDIHDLIPSAIAAILRGYGICCCETIDEANPAIPELGEIYGRYLLPRQPLGPIFSIEDREALKELLTTVALAERSVWEELRLFEPAHGGSFRFKEASPWANEVRRGSRQTAKDALVYERDVPAWDYFHSPRTYLTVAHCEPLAHLVREAAGRIAADHRLETEDGLFLSDGPFQNFIPASVLTRSRRLIKKLERQMQIEQQEPALLPLEDRVLIAGEQHLASIPAACDRIAFARARERLSRRRRSEARLLYGPQLFEWADSVPADRFEDLVRELLQASGELAWIRSAGPTNERDRGQDLVAEWWRPAAQGVVPQGALPASLVKAVVQCKAKSGTVGKADVRDVRDTLERHEAGGYFLAVSTKISNDLVNYLTGLRARTGGFVDWWTRAEIEDSLRRNPEIAARYADIVVVVDSY